MVGPLLRKLEDSTVLAQRQAEIGEQFTKLRNVLVSRAASIDEVKAFTENFEGRQAILYTSGKISNCVFLASDQHLAVAIDPDNNKYIAPNYAPDGSQGAWLIISVSASGALFTFMELANQTIPADQQYIHTSGYYTPGDGGAAGLRRVASNPGRPYLSIRSKDRTLPDKTTSAANGGWWDFVCENDTLSIEQAGGKAEWVSKNNRGLDNYDRLMVAMQYMRETRGMGPKVTIKRGIYFCSKNFNPQGQIYVSGLSYRGTGAVAGFASSWLMFPDSTSCFRLESNRVGHASNAMSRIEGVVLANETWGPYTDNGHAIDASCAIKLKNVSFVQIAGDGIHIDAYTDGGGRYGEASNWVDIDCFAHSVRGTGHFVRGADANIGYSIGFSTQRCGAAGIHDQAYFVNHYIAPHLAGFGTGGVYHKGNCYSLIEPFSGGTVEPGTGLGESVWYWRQTSPGPTDLFPQWQAGDAKKYMIGGSTQGIVFGGVAVFESVYIEGGGTYGWAHGGTVFGNDMGWTDLTSVWSGNSNSSGIGMWRGTGGNGPSHPLYKTIGEGEGVHIGVDVESDNANRRTRRRGLLRSIVDGQTHVLGWKGTEDIHWYGPYGGINYTTGAKTAKTFGRMTPKPGVFVMYDWGMQSPENSNDARLFGIRAGRPSRNGYYAAGERYYYIDPRPGQVDYWVVTQPGSISAGLWFAEYHTIGVCLTSDGQKWVVVDRGPQTRSANAPVGNTLYTDPDTGMVWRPVGQQEPVFTAICVPTSETRKIASFTIQPGEVVKQEFYPPYAIAGSPVSISADVDIGDVLTTAVTYAAQTVKVRYFNTTSAPIVVPEHNMKVLVNNSGPQ